MMKKILIVSKYFHPFESGSEKTTRYIIDYLASKGMQIILFCAKGEEEKLNPKAKLVRIDSDIYDKLAKTRILKEAADIIFGFLRLLPIMITEKIDSVSVHYSESLGLPAVLLAKLFCKKSVVLWPTSSLKHSKKSESRLLFMSEKIYSFLSSAFIAKGMPSGQMRKYFKVKREKLFETVNPVEQKDYDAGEADYTINPLGIYYLGKYNEFKRPDILIRAVSLLKEEHKEKIRVSLFGDGQYESIVKSAVKNNKLEEIAFVNPPTKNVREVIRKNHVFVYPSPYEPAFSQSILESLGSARVVVCRRTEGIDKYFSSDSIIAVNPMNAEKLAKALVWIIENREKASLMAVKARSIIKEKFTFENFMKDFLVHL